jgi:hypothetical protein
MVKMKKLIPTGAAVALAMIAQAGAADLPKPSFDKTKFSQEPTACDLLAAHPDDPYRVAPGRERSEIARDYAGAIAACESAVARDPDNPRLRYQLARVLGYSGQGKLAMPHRERAIAGRYPQALFVNGFLYLTGQNENPKDVCKAGELMRESAIEGRLAGLVGFPRYAMQGTFTGCAVRQDRAEMLGFLDAARVQVAGDFYHAMLVDLLREDLQASAVIR